MISIKSRRFFQLIRDFLTIYLPKQKGCNHNTVKAYRDALNLLFVYLKRNGNLKLSEISFEKISRQIFEDYLDWLESVRNCRISTRNHRLSCIRSFYKYAANRDITIAALSIEFEKISIKKIMKGQQVKYFE